MNKVEIKNLTKDYKNNKGVFNISLNVKEGEVFGFLGPNGAGKTTTIRQLLGFISSDSGECRINGLDCFKDSARIQEKVGYIPGEIFFMNNMTGIEFIRFMAEYRGIKDLNKANELIELFELDPTSKIKKMSKGMKQKIAIIVAFMHNPEILILDEPTSGLDPLMQKKFIELLMKEKKMGKTIFLSSHMFEEVEKTCDRVSIIKDGKIVAVDTIDNLKNAKSKKYTISFKSISDAKDFEKLNSWCTYTKENKVTVIVKNNINELIEILANYELEDLEEEYQNFEDIFIEYYGGKRND